MIILYLFFLLFQLLNTYVGVLTPLNPYVFSILFIIYGFRKPVSLTNIKLLFILLSVAFVFIIVYTIKFSFLSSFSITAKAIQFNFGYLFLIPGFTILFGFFPSIKLRHVLAGTFWTLSLELLMEFIVIRILKISPAAFAHYPKVAHISLNKITGEYTADRLLGIAGNASVTGVLYVSCFFLFLGSLYREENSLWGKKNIIVCTTFIVCFFTIISGSAFFALLLALIAVWIQKKGSLLRNTILVSVFISIVLVTFSFISKLTDAFGNKFTVEYLIFLLSRDDVHGSLPYLIHQMSIGYQWYNFIFGSYYFEWGNPDAVIKTVDFFFVNLIYEFGLIGLILFFYVIRLGYLTVKRLQIIDENYLKLGIFVMVIGSLHYPAIAYMASQVFLSAVFAIAIRDRALNSDAKHLDPS